MYLKALNFMHNVYINYIFVTMWDLQIPFADLEMSPGSKILDIYSMIFKKACWTL